MENIKILELFGGVGACTRAFDRLNIPYEIADYVEIDKYAVASYNAINNTNFMPQDITTWDKNIKVDFIMHGSPCQDFSIAGFGKGGDEGTGTRSSLMYETIRIVEKLKPKYVLWENVKNLLSKKHKHNFENYLYKMQELGYNSFYEVLNAKYYGIPQNRERVFTVSIRKDISNGCFTFPPKENLEMKLKDLLETNVGEKYFINTKRAEELIYKLNETNQIKEVPICCDSTINDPKVREISNTITARYNAGIQNQKQIGLAVVEYNNKRLTKTIKDNIKDLKENSFLGCYNNKIINNGTIPTITTRINASNEHFVAIKMLDNLRIRKLTPKECWRLMGFKDNEFEKAQKVNSNAQLYKQAGNSIVVVIIEKILKELFTNVKQGNEFQQITFDMLN